MKSLLRLSLALLTFTHHSLAHASPSHELPKPAERREGPDIQGILHDLLGDDLSAFSGFTPKVLIQSNDFPNAYAQAPGNICITSALLELIQTRDELAFILAHEIAHLSLHRDRQGKFALLPAAERSLALTRLELEADDFALRLTRRAGYRPDAGQSVLQRLSNFGTELGVPLASFSPALEVRIRQLTAPKDQKKDHFPS